MKPIARFPHLVRRFCGVLSARVDASELVTLDRYLNASERDLFLLMRVADQRHSLDLCRRLEGDGHTDPDLLRAALLHDVGKAFGPLPLPHRVIFSFCRLVSPGLASWLARRDSPRWCRPFFLAANHADIGARAAARAGSNPRVVGLIGGHDSPGRDRLSRLLYHYDGRM